MEAPTPNQADDFEAERAIWSTIRAIQEAKGLDLEAVLRTLATSERSRLSEEGAGRDFEALCEKGCHPWILAGLLALFRQQEPLKEFWAQVVGTVEERDASLRVLDDAAATVDRLFGGLLAGDDSPQFSRIGRLSPVRLADELRFYGRMINLAALWSADMKIRSLDQFVMLTLTNYVERATSAPHHALLAGLLSETGYGRNYSEEAQRQWRYRNRELLDDLSSPVLGFAAMLYGFGQVLPRTP